MDSPQTKIAPGVSESPHVVSDRDKNGVADLNQVGDQRTSSADSIYTRRWLLNSLYLVLGDIIALSISLGFAIGLRYYLAGEVMDMSWALYIVGAWGLGAWITSLYPGWGLGVVEELRRSVLVLAFVYSSLAVLLLISLSAKDTSRLTYLASMFLALPLIPFIRSRVKLMLLKQKQWGVPCAIYGAGITGLHLLDVLRAEQGLGYTAHCILDDNEDYWGIKINGVPVVGGTDIVCTQTPVAILSITNLNRDSLVRFLDGPLSKYRKVVVIPNMLDAPSVWVQARDMGGMLGLELTNNLLKPAARISKRLADLIISTFTAPIWLPITFLFAGLIWLEDRSNPFYSQERVGQNGKTFRAWKLRTMVPNAEEVLEKKLAEDEALRAEWDMYRKLRKDPRITATGAFLRRLSLDEFPQLLNVFKGEMSLVGPRPLPEYHHDELSSRTADLRTRVRPGITGLWQVSGRSDTGNEGFERYDAYYVKNWSVWLDTVILVRTIKAVLWGKGAY